MGDADDSYALDDIGGFLDALRDGADLVMGNRFQGGIEPGAMPFLHRYLGILCSPGPAGCSSASRSATSTAACARSAATASLRLGLRTEGMEFASEMVVRASLQGLRSMKCRRGCAPTGAVARPTCAPGATAGATCGSSSAFSPRWFLLYPGLAMIARRAARAGPAGRRQPDHRRTHVRRPHDARLRDGGDRRAAGRPASPSSPGPTPRGSGCCRAIHGWRGGSNGPRSNGGCCWAGCARWRASCASSFALVTWGSTGFGALDPVTTMQLPILGMVLIVGGTEIAVVGFAVSLIESTDRAAD